MKPRILILLAAAILAGSPRSAAAQANPDSVRHRNQCRLASQVLLTGAPAPHKNWAWTYIDSCSPAERVSVYTHAVQQARATSDLPELHRAIMPIVWFRDGQLFDEVMELAADASATVPARIVAFVALASLRNPQAAPSYTRFIGATTEVNGVPVAQCSGRRAHTPEFVTGPSPLPDDYRERIDAVALQVSRDPSQPRDVRSAAACTEQ
jgi:hypothetical protein